MSDWTLMSLVGNQVFRFESGFTLAAGESVTITSGGDAFSDPPGTLLWTTNWIWNNGGDPGELRDAGGNLMAQSN